MVGSSFHIVIIKMMYKITRVTPGGLLTTFLVALMICSALVESRPNSPVLSAAQRKPPFNGSIFGKRSQIAPSEGVEIYYEPQMVYGGTSSGGFGGLGSSGTNNFMLGDIIRPRDSPIRTTMNRCLSLSQREVLTGKC